MIFTNANANALRRMTRFILATMVAAHLTARTAAAAAQAPAAPEIRRGQPLREDARDDEDARATRRAAFFHRLAAKAEADGTGKPDRLTRYVEVFKRELITDARLFAFDVRARAPSTSNNDAAIILDGFTEYAEQRDALLSFLHALGFDNVEDRIATAPAAVAPDEKSFALVTVPRTFLFDRTATPRETVSECTIGEGLYLLREERDGHFLCHAGDGYVGYVRAQHVLRVNQTRFDDYRAADGRAVLLKPIDYDGGKLPAGAALQATAGGVVLPDGKTVRVDPQHLRRVTPDPRVEGIVKTAMAMAGTKYQWGGKTADGIDCSGLVQLAYRAHGVHLPRDSDQQALVGALVATRWHRTALRRGDTLFFLGRHGTITHTALYLGDDKYIEAAGPDVRISSFDPKDKAYAERNAKSFCFARRILE